MRGDGLRPGWRALVGVVLIATLFLHGFDSSFSVDGYTMGILGLLLVLALAGEIESARVAGVGIKFRKLTLRRIESDLDDLPPPERGDDGPDDEGGDDGGEASEPPRPPQDDLRAVAEAEPMTAVLAFFSEIEQAIEGLYDPLRIRAEESASFSRQVDLLTRYGVISATEARIVLDLVGLRNSYAHGRGIDPAEAVHLIAVGARLLPTLDRARRRLNGAFEERVGQILESVPGLSFSRQPVLEGSVRRRPDFLVTEPKRVVIEAKLITHPANVIKRSFDVEAKYRDLGPDDLVVVVPILAREYLERRRDRFRHRWLSIDELGPWFSEGLESAEPGT